MKKKMAYLLLAICMAFTFVACGQQEQEVEETKEEVIEVQNDVIPEVSEEILDMQY